MRTCKHCTRSTKSHDNVARAEGWRWYDGPTLGGKHLVDVVCPVCAGRTEASTDERWNVGCTTCSGGREVPCLGGGLVPCPDCCCACGAVAIVSYGWCEACEDDDWLDAEIAYERSQDR